MDMVEEAARKIETMEVRGASRIARFAAETLMNYALTIRGDFDAKMKKAAERLLNTRPTAVSLFNAIKLRDEVRREDGRGEKGELG